MDSRQIKDIKNSNVSMKKSLNVNNILWSKKIDIVQLFKASDIRSLDNRVVAPLKIDKDFSNKIDTIIVNCNIEKASQRFTDTKYGRFFSGLDLYFDMYDNNGQVKERSFLRFCSSNARQIIFVRKPQNDIISFASSRDNGAPIEYAENGKIERDSFVEIEKISNKKFKIKRLRELDGMVFTLDFYQTKDSSLDNLLKLVKECEIEIFAY